MIRKPRGVNDNPYQYNPYYRGYGGQGNPQIPGPYGSNLMNANVNPQLFPQQQRGFGPRMMGNNHVAAMPPTGVQPQERRDVANNANQMNQTVATYSHSEPLAQWDAFRLVSRDDLELGRDVFRLATRLIKLVLYFLFAFLLVISCVVSLLGFAYLTRAYMGESKEMGDVVNEYWKQEHERMNNGSNSLESMNFDKLELGLKSLRLQYTAIVRTLLFLLIIGPTAFCGILAFLRTWFTGSNEWPSFTTLCYAFVTEFFAGIGIALLVFEITPCMPLIPSMYLTHCTTILPATLSIIVALFARKVPNIDLHPKKTDKTTNEDDGGIALGHDPQQPLRTEFRALAFTRACLAFGLLVGSMIFVKVAGINFELEFTEDDPRTPPSISYWRACIAVLCISLQWLLNFANRNLRAGGRVLRISSLQKDHFKHKERITMFMSAIKVVGLCIALAFIVRLPDNHISPPTQLKRTLSQRSTEKLAGTTNGLHGMQLSLDYTFGKGLDEATAKDDNDELDPLDTNDTLPISTDEIDDMMIPIDLEQYESDLESQSDWLMVHWVAMMILTAMIVSHCVSIMACKLVMQTFSFALPLALTVPTVLLILMQGCQTVEIEDLRDVTEDPLATTPAPTLIESPFFEASRYEAPPSAAYIAHTMMLRNLPRDLCPPTQSLQFWGQLAVLLCGWLASLLVSAHIWSPKTERLADSDKLFVLGGFVPAVMPIWLMMNRRISDVLSSTRASKKIGLDTKTLNGLEKGRTHDTTIAGKKRGASANEKPTVRTKIFACATMWHETRNEMMSLLKSVFRMDRDWNERARAQLRLGSSTDPDAYDYETHIFFDDSMTLQADLKTSLPNQFVEEFINTIDDAASAIIGRPIKLHQPTRVPTPYGGRLVWRLPGGTPLVVHMKDKNRIRHKKRWSQVMYMYYLLGYRLYCEDDVRFGVFKGQEDDMRSMAGDESLLSKESAKNPTNAGLFTNVMPLSKLDVPAVLSNCSPSTIAQADNTFLLTLDGDVDFKPEAVIMLVDLMRKSRKIGAACGRIHPIGTGPMVWYQQFEYSIAHWLQKAAEHVFGCVLCSPGCFSLFRGSALMDDNVMRCYATTSSQASHYVQYDQGEDRWLCTLLLQQGYRVEYAAGSDALTYCPETFSEFYNQRRRWGPSTLSNIMDLLTSWKTTCILNDNISVPYMVYQFVLFLSTLLGPATIIMMISGAYNAVLGVSLHQSYLISITPPIFYTIVCLKCKSSVQVTVAGFLSAFYSMVMLVVIIGTIINGLEESLTSPNILFMFFLTTVFIVSAGAHPKEFHNLFYGLLYFVCIPSGYLLLTIYSLCNMNNVSWGTREIPRPKTAAEIEEEAKEREKEAKRKREKSWMMRLGITPALNELKDTVKQIVGSQNKSQETVERSSDMLAQLHKAISELPTALAKSQRRVTFDADTAMDEPGDSTALQLLRKETFARSTQTDPGRKLQTVKVHDEPLKNEEVDSSTEDDVRNPAWLKQDKVGTGPIEHLPDFEETFFRQLIDRYLYPLNEDKHDKKRIASELKVLRNNVVFAVYMLNLVWIIITYQLQMYQDLLQYAIFVPIPRGDDKERMEYFEPLGMVFLVLFTMLMLVQFFGMLWHRVSTLFHLVAITDLVPPGCLASLAASCLRRLRKTGVRNNRTAHIDVSKNAPAQRVPLINSSNGTAQASHGPINRNPWATSTFGSNYSNPTHENI